MRIKYSVFLYYSLKSITNVNFLAFVRCEICSHSGQDLGLSVSVYCGKNDQKKIPGTPLPQYCPVFFRNFTSSKNLQKRYSVSRCLKKNLRHHRYRLDIIKIMHCQYHFYKKKTQNKKIFLKLSCKLFK